VIPWNTRFRLPIVRKDGRFATLGEAREFISTLPPINQGAELWQDVEELLARAATSPSAMDEALGHGARRERRRIALGSGRTGNSPPSFCSTPPNTRAISTTPGRSSAVR
jgi:hypothetical protein